MELALRVDGLGKRYCIPRAATRSRYQTLQEDLLALPRNLVRRVWQRESTIDEIWALRDVSFDVQAGEVLGIIGRNGAGKSTLLKILSRITRPSRGRAEIYGRVGSLLEVGTGFHPELTGRENIYLNGAILGMRRSEISRRFDDIVAFAEVEQFIDTPVKRYSSGMYMRLAFAVAAHLDPEILVVDEVLAVGDVEFQRKCLGKMNEVSRSGRTVLFVSHNMAAVQQLCTRGLLLDQGSIVLGGPIEPVVAHYLASTLPGDTIVTLPLRPDADIQFRSVGIQASTGAWAAEVPDNEPFQIVCEVTVRTRTPDIYFGLVLQNMFGVNVLFVDSRDGPGNLPSRLSAGDYTFTVPIPAILAAGLYFVSVGIATTSLLSLDHHERVCSFQILSMDAHRVSERPGIVNLRIPWNQL